MVELAAGGDKWQLPNKIRAVYNRMITSVCYRNEVQCNTVEHYLCTVLCSVEMSAHGLRKYDILCYTVFCALFRWKTVCPLCLVSSWNKRKLLKYYIGIKFCIFTMNPDFSFDTKYFRNSLLWKKGTIEKEHKNTGP